MKTPIFKTSKLIKLNQIKYILVFLHNWMTRFEAGTHMLPLQMAFCSLHFYFKSSNFGEILKCVLEPCNKNSRNTIKVLSTKGGKDWTRPRDIGQNTCSRNGYRNDTVIGS